MADLALYLVAGLPVPLAVAVHLATTGAVYRGCGRPLIDPFTRPDVSDDMFRSLMRFDREDVVLLARELGLPEVVSTEECHSERREVALAMLLYKYAKDNDGDDSEVFFGVSKSKISRIVSAVERHIYYKAAPALAAFHPTLVDRARVELYAAKVRAKGCPHPHAFAFLDGMKWEICKPGGANIIQKGMYSGYTGHHCLSYQVVSGPDGMCLHAFGPCAGRDNDLGVLAASQLLKHMHDRPDLFADAHGVPSPLIGDSIYPRSDHLLSPFRVTNVAAALDKWNKQARMCRVSVEWLIGKVYNTFRYLHHFDRHEIERDPVAWRVVTGILLANAHTCLYGSEASRYFHCHPPSLHDYLAPIFQ